ncbi:unnamed protein product [Cochlearia groenlandica]
MMAGGEGRAVWQRTVNRYFVQEDAKRAPKLTSYQSSSSTKLPEDCGSSRPLVVDPHNQPSPLCFMPLHLNHNFTDHLPHNTVLWEHHLHIHPNQNEHVKNKPLEADGIISDKDTKESYGSDMCHEFSENKLLNELAFDSTSPWNPLSSEKSGPWWRTTDKDELASLVAQRSLDYVENCDLPTPQKMKISHYGNPQDNSVVSNQTIHKHEPSRGSYSKNRTEVSSESDLSKPELLDALRHSQTRAREAENKAKEAYAEKEHLVKILFKQASELFGYRQWIQLLQLEVLYLQIKNKKIENNNNEPPVSISWGNSKGKKQGRKGRNKRAKPNEAKYRIGLALGMSLVGAGLLLGWTVGWMQMLSL